MAEGMAEGMAEVAAEGMDEGKMKAKSKKLAEIMEANAQMVLKDVEKIVCRSLTDEEKKSLLSSIRAFFLITSLMMSTL